MTHHNIVQNSQLFLQTLESLGTWDGPEEWGSTFVDSLARSENQPTKSAWLLEYANDTTGDGIHSYPGQTEFSAEVLHRHARVILESKELFEMYPTYWEDLFHGLGI